MAGPEIDSSFARSDDQVRVTTNVSYPQGVAANVSSAPDIILADNVPGTTALSGQFQINVQINHAANTITTPTFQLGTTASLVIVRETDDPLLVGDTGGVGYTLQLKFNGVINKWVLLNPFNLSAAEVPDETITNDMIVQNSILQNRLADNSVGTAEILDNAVITQKIADLAITTAKIALLGVDTAQIADNAVTTDKINAQAVTTDKIINDAVTYAKIQDVSGDNLMLGRFTGGSGVIQEGSVNNVLSLFLGFSGTVIAGAINVVIPIDGSISIRIIATSATVSSTPDTITFLGSTVFGAIPIVVLVGENASALTLDGTPTTSSFGTIGASSTTVHYIAIGLA